MSSSDADSLSPLFFYIFSFFPACILVICFLPSPVNLFASFQTIVFNIFLQYRGNSWTGEYIADFRSLLPRIDEYLRSNDQDSQRLQTVESLDMEETDLSLVSGRILLRPGVVAIEMDHATVASEGKHDENSIQALERIPSLEERARSFALQHTKVFADSSAGARFLLGREYQGLDPQLEQDSSLSISQGRSGLPMMYTHEDNNV